MHFILYCVYILLLDSEEQVSLQTLLLNDPKSTANYVVLWSRI